MKVLDLRAWACTHSGHIYFRHVKLSFTAAGNEEKASTDSFKRRVISFLRLHYGRNSPCGYAVMNWVRGNSTVETTGGTLMPFVTSLR